VTLRPNKPVAPGHETNVPSRHDPEPRAAARLAWQEHAAAMAAGISDHIWTCEEIAALLD
jgi:hypothetical protein